jgi:hypothetical protein
MMVKEYDEYTFKEPTSVSFVASVGVDATTITIPATAQAGDIAIFWDAAADSTSFSTPINTSISGWTKVISQYFNTGAGGSGDQQQQQVFIKILTSGDVGSTITGSSVNTATGARRKIIAVFRGTSISANSSINNYTFNGFTSEYSSATPANKTITSSSGKTPSIAIALYRIGGSPSTYSFSPTQDGSQNGGLDTTLMYWKMYNSSPSNITIGMTDGGNLNYLGGFYLSLY